MYMLEQFRVMLIEQLSSDHYTTIDYCMDIFQFIVLIPAFFLVIIPNIKNSRWFNFKSKRIRSFSLDLFLPISVASDVQASIDDEFLVWEKAHGYWRARLIRKFQIIQIVLGHYKVSMLAFTGILLKFVNKH